MSGHTSAHRFFRPTPTHPAAGSSFGAWARAAIESFALMRRAAETRRELGSLNPRLLADIGVSRAEAEREAARWPWDTDPARAPRRGGGAHW